MAECVVEDRTSYEENRGFLEQAAADYQAASAAMSWYTLPRVPRGTPHRVVAGSLTKAQLTSLYTDRMVGTSGGARRIYDEIQVAANGDCPFCGGVGHVFTLDHYLPKSSFPLFSVLPANLVPCCRDCNTGKSATFGTTAEQQPLHPYLDDPKLFNQRWVRARLVPSDPIGVLFYCAAPAAWSPTEQARVASHFTDYDLANRYRKLAGAEINKVVGQRRGTLRGMSPGGFHEYLLEAASEPGYDLNGWNRTTYAALADTEWFWRGGPL
ncbi:HNH endonuclease [Neorhizobium sp. T6_25]|uniref:HNH endonuclease n=1 Tax=Neorhizobium sp. T6_25 TaxID=2093833 RepID=UPI00155EB865|nr:HNH endonuclease [Neorhizobium sp. T6_25]